MNNLMRKEEDVVFSAKKVEEAQLKKSQPLLVSEKGASRNCLGNNFGLVGIQAKVEGLTSLQQ